MPVQFCTAVSTKPTTPFILWPMVEGRGFHLQVIHLCANAGFVPMISQEAHGMHAVLSLVSVGAGVSVVPQSMSGFRGEQVSYYPLPCCESEFDLVLGYRHLSPSAKAFVRSAEEKRSVLHIAHKDHPTENKTDRFLYR